MSAHQSPAAFAPAFEASPTRRDGWSPALQVRFLDALARGGNVRAAAASVGMSAQGAYVLRRRDAGFAAGRDAALVLARQAAEQVLATRAIDGVEEIVFYRGEEVGRRRRYDSRLLLAHLARLDHAVEENPGAEALAERFDEVLAEVLGDEADDGFVSAAGMAAEGAEEGEASPAPPAWSGALGPTREAAVRKAEAREQVRWGREPADHWEPDPDTLAEAAAAPDAVGMDPLDLHWNLWMDDSGAAVAAAGARAGAAWDARHARAVATVDAVLAAANPCLDAAGEGGGATAAQFPPLDRVNRVNFAVTPLAIGRAPGAAA